LSNSKYVYVLNRGHLNRLENLGEDECVKCNILFEEDDIISTSTSKRYCYECAVKINLVSGNLKKDLRNDKFVPNVLNEIKRLTKKYSIEKEISSLALFLIKTVFENTNYVTKNQLGLSCAAISLAGKLLKENDNLLMNSFPVTQKVLEKNISQLQKNLNNVSIISISQSIHDVKC